MKTLIGVVAIVLILALSVALAPVAAVMTAVGYAGCLIIGVLALLHEVWKAIFRKPSAPAPCPLERMVQDVQQIRIADQRPAPTTPSQEKRLN